jgi:hypothetical protein
MKKLISLGLIASGFLGIAAGILDWGYQYKSPGQKLFVDILGHTGTRIFSILSGVFCILIGILMFIDM